MIQQLATKITEFTADPIRLRLLIFALLLVLILTAVLAPGPHILACGASGGPCPTP